MTATDATLTVDEALDNDVALKAVRYRTTELFWPTGKRLGVLGAAKFVLGSRIKRLELANAQPAINDELAAFLGRTEVLEPSEHELTCAAELELTAQQQSLPVDTGESQLAAIVARRAVALMSTGDKRAIISFEQLLDAVDWLAELCGRVRSLEQVVLEHVRDETTFATVTDRVCNDRDADTALSICFSCYGDKRPDRDAVVRGLLSYIEALRRDAPQILAPTP